MARTVRNAKIDSRNGRSSLKQRHEPYWTVLTGGRALGYRKGKIGTWVGRYRTETGERYHKSLGTADDALDANGNDVLSYAQAQERARDWFKDLERRLIHGIATDETYTVGRAADDYLAWFGGHRKSVTQTKNVVEKFIRPELGSIEVNRLTQKRIEDWHKARADNLARVRTRLGKEQKFKTREDHEAGRRRKSTANRQLTVLKAMLNRAFQRRKETGVASDDAWRTVKPFKGVDTARVRYLTEAETLQFVDVARTPPNLPDTSPAFGKVAIGALLTGARYGELTTGRVADFDAVAGTLFVPESKSGKARYIVLTDEGREFFTNATKGRSGNALLFVDHDGEAWKKSEQLRPMAALSAAAGIDPPINFHALRHTYASRLVMRGVPLVVVAKQLGHADSRMVERNYAHLAESYIAAAVRSAFGEVGVVGVHIVPAEVVNG